MDSAPFAEREEFESVILINMLEPFYHVKSLYSDFAMKGTMGRKYM